MPVQSSQGLPHPSSLTLFNIESSAGEAEVAVHPKPIVEGWEGLGEDGWEPPPYGGNSTRPY